MEKKYYIQPKMETMVVATRELMVPGGGSPTNGGMDPNSSPMPAPKRVPTLGNDSVQVF